MSKNSDYVSAMQAKMKQLDQDISALGEDARLKARGAYDERMRELRASRDVAHENFVKLQLASESAGARMHAGMQTAWVTMRAALKKASADLGK